MNIISEIWFISKTIKLFVKQIKDDQFVHLSKTLQYFLVVCELTYQLGLKRYHITEIFLNPLNIYKFQRFP